MLGHKAIISICTLTAVSISAFIGCSSSWERVISDHIIFIYPGNKYLDLKKNTEKHHLQKCLQKDIYIYTYIHMYKYIHAFCSLEDKRITLFQLFAFEKPHHSLERRFAAARKRALGPAKLIISAWSPADKRKVLWNGDWNVAANSS